jgi:hypothetical protein
MGAEDRQWWQARTFTALKVCGAVLANFGVNCVACLAIMRNISFGVLLFPFVVLLGSIPGMFALGFVEHRMGPHLVAALLSSIIGVFTAGSLLSGYPSFGVLVEPIAVVVVAFAALLGFGGSTLGVFVSRKYYSIVPRRRGHCPACGYCLTGLPRRVCPECGRAFELEEVGMGEAAEVGSGAGDVGDESS